MRACAHVGLNADSDCIHWNMTDDDLTASLFIQRLNVELYPADQAMKQSETIPPCAHLVFSYACLWPCRLLQGRIRAPWLFFSSRCSSQYVAYFWYLQPVTHLWRDLFFNWVWCLLCAMPTGCWTGFPGWSRGSERGSSTASLPSSAAGRFTNYDPIVECCVLSAPPRPKLRQPSAVLPKTKRIVLQNKSDKSFPRSLSQNNNPTKCKQAFSESVVPWSGRSRLCYFIKR